MSSSESHNQFLSELRELLSRYDDSLSKTRKKNSVYHQVKKVLQSSECGQQSAIQPAYSTEVSSNKRVMDLFRLSSVSYYSFNKEAIILDLNEAGAKLLKTEVEKIINQSFQSFVSEKYKYEFTKHIDQTIASGDRQIIELELFDSKKQSVFVRLESFVLHSNHRPIIITAITDISDYIKSHNELNALNKEIISILDDKIIQLNEQHTNLLETTEKIRQSEKRLQNMFDKSKQLFMHLDIQANLLSFNKITRDTILYLTGKTLHKSSNFSEYFSDVQEINIFKEIKRGENIQTEWYFKSKNKWFEVHFSPVYDDNNQITSVYVTLFNITKRKQAQHRFKASYDTLQTILNNIEALVYVCDIERSELLFMNNHAKEILGEPEGKSCRELRLDDENNVCKNCPKKISNNGKVYEWEYHDEKNDLWYNIINRPIEWINGRKVRMEIATDVSKQKKLAETLATRERYLDTIVTIQWYLVIFDEDETYRNKVLKLLGEVSGANRVYLFENSKNANNQLCFNHKAEWQSDDPDNLMLIENKQLQNLCYKKGFDNWYKILSREKIVRGQTKEFEGEERDFLDNLGAKYTLIFPLLVNDEFFGFIGFDNTTDTRSWNHAEISLLRSAVSSLAIFEEKRKGEIALKVSEKKLRELNATKDKFFSIIAHDLRNPFNTLIGFSEILMDNFDEYQRPEIEENLKIIFEAALSGYKLLENLLDWSRSQTGRITYKPDNFDLYQIVEDNVDLHFGTANNKNIKLINAVPEPTMAYGDKNMITTVLRNLISNALKFTPQQGMVAVKVLTLKDKGYDPFLDDTHIQLAVQDTGIGISKEDQNKLFRIDVNHTTIGTSREKGTGLGLILCKEFIERNNGNIRVLSKEGKGSSFIFSLPKPKK